MDHWSLVGYLLIALILVGCFQRMSLQQLSQDKESRQSKSERTVVFPVMNETEHSLPIFPGQERRTQNTGVGSQNTEVGTRNTGTRNTGTGTRNIGVGIRNTEGGSRNTEGGSRNTGGGTRNMGVGGRYVGVATVPPTSVHKYVTVNYVGSKRPLAPRVDDFGQPFCKNKSEDTFCETVDDYPDTDIKRAIHYSSEEFKELFGTQTINPRKIAPSDVSEETVCPQQARLFYPKAAVNENDRWAYVVNDVDYVQAVMAEMCEGEDRPCSYLDGALPSGVSSRCRQKFAYKRLLALHPEQKKTYTDAFRFPSCCVCYVKRPYILQRTRLIRVDDKKTDNRQSSDRNRGT